MQSAGLPDYLEILNPEQKQAVLHTGKPLLILAGAGSGKTRVITTKIAWLIREKGVDPRSILAVTFTNKAAREMAERAAAIDGRAADAMLRTFHSFGAWFLRRNAVLAGLAPGFVIYDDDDTASLLSTIMEGVPRAEVRAAARNISRAKDYFLSPDDPALDRISYSKQFNNIYRDYENKLAAIGNVDFGDLIKKPVEILRNNPDVAQRIRGRFRVILVDEYQDANVAQFELLKELCDSQTYVCVVGDDDQSIYRFRGAEVRNILQFPDRFPGTDIIRLERNYRSIEPILEAASSVVDKNKNRLGKKLRSERGPGKKPVLAFLADQDEEAGYCADLIETLVKKGNKYSDWAVLYRTNAQSLGFETEFLHRRIPYKVVGSLKFYEREEIKDILAMLAFLVNPRDEVAFRRVINKPSRGVGPSSVERIIDAAASNPEAPGDLEAAIGLVKKELSAKAGAGTAQFLKAVKAGRAALNQPDQSEQTVLTVQSEQSEQSDQSDQSAAHQDAASAKNQEDRKRESLRSAEGLSRCVVTLANQSGLADYHLSHDEIAGNQRLNNLQELANASSIYPASIDGLLEFLEHIELDRSMEENSDNGSLDTVTLITIHNTKGLEFRRVIMTGVEQGVFPREDKSGDELEEERRLFYVGATRAMDELYFSCCRMRRMYGRTGAMYPSVFLNEIDRKALRVIGKEPPGFTKSAKSAEGFPRTQNRASPPDNDQYWRKGDTVYHDDYGYGEVREVRDSEDGPVVRVSFQNGGEVRFLADHQGRNFTRIRDN
ncbi:MAG: ATP-dependent helicase [Treponema sp.]|nr:ATP-dependent helicase [Treponema sp.]